MTSYTTLSTEGNFTFEDRKSVFIAKAVPIVCEEDATRVIAEEKKRYADAKHHVYAYCLKDGNIMHYSDDKEPQGTAGMPTLDVLRKGAITDAVVVVTRYFGGTLLGTGGLVHAYTEAAAGAVMAANPVTYRPFVPLTLTLSYGDYQKLLPKFPDYAFRVKDTAFSDSVVVSGNVEKGRDEAFLTAVTELTAGRAALFVGEEIFDC